MPRKAEFLIVVKLVALLKSKLFIWLYSNALLPINVTPDGITNSPLIWFFSNAERPIVVTLDGIVKLIIWLP